MCGLMVCIENISQMGHVRIAAKTKPCLYRVADSRVSPTHRNDKADLRESICR